MPRAQLRRYFIDEQRYRVRLRVLTVSMLVLRFLAVKFASHHIEAWRNFLTTSCYGHHGSAPCASLACMSIPSAIFTGIQAVPPEMHWAPAISRRGPEVSILLRGGAVRGEPVEQGRERGFR